MPELRTQEGQLGGGVVLLGIAWAPATIWESTTLHGGFQAWKETVPLAWGRVASAGPILSCSRSTGWGVGHASNSSLLPKELPGNIFLKRRPV